MRLGIPNGENMKNWNISDVKWKLLHHIIETLTKEEKSPEEIKAYMEVITTF